MRRVLGLMLLALAATVGPAAAAPCVTEAACVEWMPLGTTGGRVLVYRSLPLDAPARTVTRAIIVIHGGSAGAGGHFAAGIEAARLAGVLDDTLVIAPRIPSNDDYVCNDRLDEREINWGCQANNGWPAGGTATGDDALTSYDVTDEILRRLARKATFPNLRSVVIVGHSAGGQYVTRYVMANQMHERLGVRVSYVVANPAHYAYPDAGRLDGDGRELPADQSRSGCKIYDDWPYGLQDRRGYAARVADSELRMHLASRPVTYLLGELDTLTTGGLDTTCAAMAQGANRLRRGQIFAAYVGAKYKASQSVVVVVPGCGHSTRCMLTAPAALPVLFPAAAPAPKR